MLVFDSSMQSSRRSIRTTNVNLSGVIGGATLRSASRPRGCGAETPELVCKLRAEGHDDAIRERTPRGGCRCDEVFSLLLYRLLRQVPPLLIEIEPPVAR